LRLDDDDDVSFQPSSNAKSTRMSFTPNGCVLTRKSIDLTHAAFEGRCRRHLHQIAGQWSESLSRSVDKPQLLMYPLACCCFSKRHGQVLYIWGLGIVLLQYLMPRASPITPSGGTFLLYITPVFRLGKRRLQSLAHRQLCTVFLRPNRFSFKYRPKLYTFLIFLEVGLK
jgi:hypothetical protein